MAKKFQPSADFLIFEDTTELPESDLKLIEAAREACKLAYAPYSGFWVGAALLLENGEIVKGANQENAAYPSGLCAERVAIFSLTAKHADKKVLKMAVIATEAGKDPMLPAPPCGACRQVMLELESRQDSAIEVLLLSTEGKWVKSPSASALLPFCFGQNNLIP